MNGLNENGCSCSATLKRPAGTPLRFRPLIWSYFQWYPLRSEKQHVLCIWSWTFCCSLMLKYLVGYFRSAHLLGGDVCTIVTIFLVIRQSGEGCPCQEGGQGTNSFLFLDTSIYQAWLHASHTLKVGVHVCVFVYTCWLEKGERRGEVELCA